MIGDGLIDIEAHLVVSTYSKTIDLFKNMALKSDLLNGLYEVFLGNPSALQQRVVPQTIQGHDVVVVAQPAAGKTTALCISILQKIDPNIKACQALILVSNQEVARQIQNLIGDIGHFMHISRPADIVGSDAGVEINTLHDNQQIVIGEPNQVYDMIRSGTIAIDNVNLLALDEADKLLSCNIDEQICDIHKLLPECTQVIFLSATESSHMLKVAARIMRDPLHIIVKRTKHPLNGIKQSYIAVETDDCKLDILSELDESSALAQGIIFCNTRRMLEWLEQNLIARGLDICAMHADMYATDRAAIMADFYSSTSRVMIATQMLARGLNVQQMTIVVNFDLPVNPEDYVNRVGLGGRPDRRSTVLNLITLNDVLKAQEIEKFYNIQFEQRH